MSYIAMAYSSHPPLLRSVKDTRYLVSLWDFIAYCDAIKWSVNNLGEWAMTSHGKGTRPCMKVANVDFNHCGTTNKIYMIIFID